MALIKKEDGLYYDSVTGTEVNVTQEELNTLAVVDKDSIFTSRLKDQFNMEASQLTDISNVANEARTQEKTKLYNEIEDSKNKALALETKNAEIAGEMKALTDQIVELKKAPPAKGGDKPNEEITKQIKQMETIITNLKTEKDTAITEQKELFTAYKTDMQNLIKLDKLAQFKATAIASSNGRIIPEMVNGDSEESITLAVECAKQKFESIAKTTADKIAEENKPKGSTPLQLDTNITLHGNKALTSEDMANMSDEEYATHRKTLLDKAGVPMMASR